MGIVSKDSGRVSAGSSRRKWKEIPMAWAKKIALLLFMVFLFAIYNRALVPSAQPHTQYLNRAVMGEMGWASAFKMTAWQGLEFGTKNAIAFIENIVTYMGNAQPIEAVFLAGFPLFMVLVIWLIPVTMVFDLLDQRKTRETRYSVQLLTAVAVMLVFSLVINGFGVFHDFRATQNCDDLSDFTKEGDTYLSCMIGDVNHTISPGQYVSYNVSEDTWQRNMSGSDLSFNGTLDGDPS